MLIIFSLRFLGESWDSRVVFKIREGRRVNKYGCIKQFGVKEYEREIVSRYVDEEGICGFLRELLSVFMGEK